MERKCYYCEDFETYKKACDKLHKLGYKWFGGDSLLNYIPRWSDSSGMTLFLNESKLGVGKHITYNTSCSKHALDATKLIGHLFTL